MTNELRKVLIATPSYDGKIDAFYVNSLHNSVLLGLQQNILLQPIFITSDALVQRARNDLLTIGVQGLFESMVWIDADLEWNPEWLIQLINANQDVIGGTYRKKTDNAELYTVNTDSLEINEHGLIEVNGLGTGFVKLSNAAMVALWNTSEPYTNKEGRDSRMAFDIDIIDGELVGEDMIMFRKLKKLGFKVFLDPKMTLNHNGTKQYRGNFEAYSTAIRGAN